MDNDELITMMKACIKKLKNKSFYVDLQTECYICKTADAILNENTCENDKSTMI